MMGETPALPPTPEAVAGGGLSSSHLSVWRKQRDEAALAGLVPNRRGRKPDPNAALVAENQRLRRFRQTAGVVSITPQRLPRGVPRALCVARSSSISTLAGR